MFKYAVLSILLCSTAYATDEAAMIRAVAQVESGGNDSATGDNGLAVGRLQIHPILVKDVNRIAGTHYTLEDRKDAAKSAEMFVIYCRHYAGPVDAEKWSKCWNAGGAWRSKPAKVQKRLDAYWNKVEAQLAKDSK